MRKGKRNRNIMRVIELLLRDGEWYGLYDIVALTGCRVNTIRNLMGRIGVDRKKIRKWGIEGTYYRLRKEEKKRAKMKNEVSVKSS